MNKPSCGTTLITGASTGIGAALAREFAAHGHDLILVARSLGKLQALADELSAQHGIRAEVIAQDLAAPDAAAEVHAEVQRRGLTVDILVNNAGLLFEGPYWETPLASHQQLVQVNIGAVMALTHHFLPGMIARGRGRVLNLASTSAFQPVPYLATYAASKAFVLSFSEALSIELKGRGVTVTALCPGFTETEMIAKAEGKSMSVPLVRNMTAEEVAQEGYVACMTGRPMHVNGLANRALVTLGRLQPKVLQRWVIEHIAKAGVL
ncbi:MAG: SDR family oxidoreductase [Pseudomonadota bacterium]